MAGNRQVSRRAVWLEGRAIYNRWDREGILPHELRRKETRAALELDKRRTHILPPDLQLEHKEARTFEATVLTRVFARVRQSGSARDCMILDLLEQGRSPAQATSELGLKMSAWEALRRKMERWGREEAQILQSEMSSRRASAA